MCTTGTTTKRCSDKRGHDASQALTLSVKLNRCQRDVVAELFGEDRCEVIA
jgi:hypothetical protein